MRDAGCVQPARAARDRRGLLWRYVGEHEEQRPPRERDARCGMPDAFKRRLVKVGLELLLDHRRRIAIQSAEPARELAPPPSRSPHPATPEPDLPQLGVRRLRERDAEG